MRTGHNTSKLRQLATAALLALVAGPFSAVLITSPSHAAASSAAGQWPQTSPDQYNTPTPVDSSCTPGPSSGSYQDVNGQMTWVAGGGSPVCWWNVARDPSNPDPNWDECQFWAVELRPDIYTNVIEPTEDWQPYDWVKLAKEAGYIVSNTPAVGDLAIWPNGYDNAGTDGGHVGYVTAINADGQQDDSIITSDMNVDGNSGGNGADLYTSASVVDGDGSVVGGVAQHLYFIEKPGGSAHPVPPATGGTGTSTKPSSGGSTGGSGGSGGSTRTRPQQTAFTIAKRVINGKTLRVTVTVVRGISSASVQVSKGRVKHRLRETKRGQVLTFRATLPRGMWHVAISLTAEAGYRTPAAPSSVAVLKK